MCELRNTLLVLWHALEMSGRATLGIPVQLGHSAGDTDMGFSPPGERTVGQASAARAVQACAWHSSRSRYGGFAATAAICRASPPPRCLGPRGQLQKLNARLYEQLENM
jgi:hypothetical protein